TLNYHASKGEGIAGTPEWIYNQADATDANFTGTVVNTSQPSDGYPGGSMGRGAPGNAGGGGTDPNPAANNENTGGGGGGNGGAGGQGGYGWDSPDVSSPASDLQKGGRGGAAIFPAQPSPGAFNSLTLGGGGGAGTRNNSSGAASSGGAG